MSIDWQEWREIAPACARVVGFFAMLIGIVVFLIPQESCGTWEIMNPAGIHVALFGGFMGLCGTAWSLIKDIREHDPLTQQEKKP